MSRQVSMQFGKPGTVSGGGRGSGGGGGGDSDTGWIDATLESEFALHDTDAKVQYRKIGSIVFVRGTVKPTRTITSNATLHPIFSMPSAFAPSYEQNFTCQGTGVARWLLTVSPDGSVNFSRYGIGQYSNPGTSVWLSFSACFAVE